MASHAFALPADGSGWASRAPVREGCRLETLIDGIPTFQRMERAILRARRTVHLSAWVFQPETPLKSREARREGASWGDLLVSRARRGVQVRLLLSVLDPYFKGVDHRASWQAARALWDRAAKFPEERQGKLQVICTTHEATVETGIATVIGPQAQALVARLNKYRQGHGKAAALARYADMPGIWRNVRWRSDRERFELVRADDLVIHPASHHQKTCIVDGRVAYCGGLDIARGRLDTPEHKGMLWHDIACEIEGDAAGDIERNFVGRWNLERERYLEFVAGANALKRGVSIAGVVPTEARLPAAPSAAPGSSQVQVLRTLTGNARWSRLPSVIRSDIEDAHAVAIAQARQYVYLENQYLREPAIVKWFRDCDAIGRLQVILVLPVAPEEAAASPIDEVTLHGLYLQRKVLTDLRTLLGDRLGIYSMVQRKRSGSQSHPTTSHGSTQIYVHSKCLIVDDEFAIIGSANATRRSFRVDSELSVGWFDPERVTAFRQQLWNELLGSPQGLEQWPLSGLVRQWEQIATGNESAPAVERRGFIVRHDPDRKAVRGQKSTLLPDEFADLGGESLQNEMPV